MSEPDFIELEKRLVDALSTRDPQKSELICDEIADAIFSSDSIPPLKRSWSILYQLRKKRRFDLLLQVGEAVIATGQTNSQIKILYAQALVDQGRLSAAEPLANQVFTDPEVSQPLKLEVIGMLGRIHKQRFVNIESRENEEKTASLLRALDKYYAGFELDKTSYWHAINYVALFMRGLRDGHSLEGRQAPEPIALGIIDQLSKEDDVIEEPKPWELATFLETQIALGKFAEARETALEYSACRDADAFEYGSTLRQLLEIWQLEDGTPPGDDILPILRSSLLDREGGAVSLSPESIAAEKLNLEAKFGDNASKTIKWYKQGLERTGAIVRIEMPDGRGIGTASVVNGAEFFPDSQDMLLMTNAHVVSNNPADPGLPPSQVRANIQAIGEVFEVEEVVWSSSVAKLDSSFLKIKGLPEVEPLPIASKSIQMSDPPPRVYVIGHPNGRDLEISLNDNRMVGANETFVHYRTPTEPGSSGSPVFDQYGWEVIALHHGGGDNIPRLDDSPGTYKANEGIAISAIKKAIQES